MGVAHIAQLGQCVAPVLRLSMNLCSVDKLQHSKNHQDFPLSKLVFDYSHTLFSVKFTGRSFSDSRDLNFQTGFQICTLKFWSEEVSRTKITCRPALNKWRRGSLLCTGVSVPYLLALYFALNMLYIFILTIYALRPPTLDSWTSFWTYGYWSFSQLICLVGKPVLTVFVCRYLNIMDFSTEYIRTFFLRLSWNINLFVSFLALCKLHQ